MLEPDPKVLVGELRYLIGKLEDHGYGYETTGSYEALKHAEAIAEQYRTLMDHFVEKGYEVQRLVAEVNRCHAALKKLEEL